MKAINRTTWMMLLVFGITTTACAQDTVTKDGTVEVLSVERFDKLIHDTKNSRARNKSTFPLRKNFHDRWKSSTKIDLCSSTADRANGVP